MLGFEPRISGVGSYDSASCATTAAQSLLKTFWHSNNSAKCWRHDDVTSCSLWCSPTKRRPTKMCFDQKLLRHPGWLRSATWDFRLRVVQLHSPVLVVVFCWAVRCYQTKSRGFKSCRMLGFFYFFLAQLSTIALQSVQLKVVLLYIILRCL